MFLHAPCINSTELGHQGNNRDIHVCRLAHVTSTPLGLLYVCRAAIVVIDFALLRLVSRLWVTPASPPNPTRPGQGPQMSLCSCHKFPNASGERGLRSVDTKSKLTATYLNLRVVSMQEANPTPQACAGNGTSILDEGIIHCSAPLGNSISQNKTISKSSNFSLLTLSSYQHLRSPVRNIRFSCIHGT